MKLWYRIKKNYVYIRRKYLSWIMAIGQASDKTGMAVYKVQAFEQTVNASVPLGINILWLTLRSIGGMFVSGMGTFERMKVPNTKFLYNAEYHDVAEYYDQWVSYYSELARLYGAHNNELVVLYLINEFFSQNRTPKTLELNAFIKALPQHFILKKLSVHALDHTISQKLDSLSLLSNAQGQYKISLGEYHLILDFDNINSPVAYQPPSVVCNRETKKHFRHYASYYRTYTRLNEFLTTNDDFSAAVLLQLTDTEKLNLIEFDTIAIQRAKQFVHRESKKLKKIQEFDKTLLALSNKILKLRDELASADVTLTQLHRELYFDKYKELRQLTYCYQFVLLGRHDAKNYQASVELVTRQNQQEKNYIARLKTIKANEQEILIALAYQRENLKGFLATNYAGKFERIFKGRFTSYVSIMNAIVTTIFACFSMFKILSWCIPLAIPITIAAGLITAFSAMSFNKNGISRTYGKFGRTLDWLPYRDRTKNRTRSLITNITFAVTAAVSAPLYYFSAISVILPVIKALLGSMLVGAAISNPLGIAICILFVASATLATIGLGCSQGRKLTELFRKYLGPHSALYKKAQQDHLQIFYWLVVTIAVIAAAATISISMVGDIFGFNAVFNLKGSWMLLPAVISFISSTATDFADILSNFLKLTFGAAKRSKGKALPTIEPVSPANGGTFGKLIQNGFTPQQQQLPSPTKSPAVIPLQCLNPVTSQAESEEEPSVISTLMC